jgi:mannosylfructose-6-phosphate phosphatase
MLRLERQPVEFQSSHKVSYYLENAGEDELNHLGNRLEEGGIDAKIIYSSARDLDILPHKADKGTAAAFLATHWNTPPDRVLSAGDSGNDLSLFEHDFRGIIVANAQAELREFHHTTVYHAKKSFAAGVLDGIEYWCRHSRKMSHPIGAKSM